MTLRSAPVLGKYWLQGLFCALVLSGLSAAPAALAVDGWGRAAWGFSPAQVRQLHPDAAAVPESRRLSCISSRVETAELEMERHSLGGRAYSVLFCFSGLRAEPLQLRSVSLFLLAPQDGGKLADELKAEHGAPYRTSEHNGQTTLMWVASPSTLLEYEYGPGSHGRLRYVSAQAWPRGEFDPKDASLVAAMKAAAQRGAAPLQGEWLYVPPGDGSGPKLGWTGPDPSYHFDGLTLLCGEGLPLGQATAYVPVAEPGPGRNPPAPVEVRVRAGGQARSAQGAPAEGPNGYTVAVPLRSGSPMLGLLAAATGSGLTIEAPPLRAQHYPLRGFPEKLRLFMAACGLGKAG